jgi:hypothetical protein
MTENGRHREDKKEQGTANIDQVAEKEYEENSGSVCDVMCRGGFCFWLNLNRAKRDGTSTTGSCQRL